jgi:hypothetical protein
MEDGRWKMEDGKGKRQEFNIELKPPPQDHCQQIPTIATQPSCEAVWPVPGWRFCAAPRRLSGTGDKTALSERRAFGSPVDCQCREFAVARSGKPAREVMAKPGPLTL